MAAMNAQNTSFSNGNADFATVNDDDTRIQAIKKGSVFLNGVHAPRAAVLAYPPPPPRAPPISHAHACSFRAFLAAA